MRVNIMLVVQCKITISPERHAEHARVRRLMRNLLPPKSEENFNIYALAVMFQSRVIQTNLCFQLAHHLLSAVLVHHAANTEGRHDPAHARKAASEPIDLGFRKSLLHRRVSVAVVHVQTQKVERRRDQLNRCWRQELRSRSAGNVALHFCRQGKRRRDHGRQVERCENREAVARREKRISDRGDGTR